MTELKVKTRGNASSQDKSKVYFTCHPDDMGKYFDKICEDIFKTYDCAVYYTEDMAEKIDETYRETDLGSMNLFAVPVTFKLLTTPNRAMDEDIAFAKEKYIPVLPFMMESSIDSIYAKPENFGEMQYLNPYSHDLTAISYEDKLKKYLTELFIDEETAKKVRAAFDAYIFLSYRKKDRHHANELMRLIHAKPEYRDIAIWYDEFLTIGESFKDNIDKMLSQSKLFTLLVTPNLLEDKNFVMEHEYPDARDAGMKILPAEMENTDKEVLAEKYIGLPNCVDPRNEAEFKARLAQTLFRIAKAENNNDDPEHNFLIGLAYLEGIDVEVNRERGIELITSAAEAELPEAMVKLYNMYNEGQYVAINYAKALYWIEKLYEFYKRTLGEEQHDTITALNNIACTHTIMGSYEKALELNEKTYTLYCKVMGEEHSDTLISLNNFALICKKLGDYKKALELNEKAYALRSKVWGEEHPDTLNSLNNLALTYSKLGDHKKAFELNENIYSSYCKIFGEEHPKALMSLNNLAGEFIMLGNYNKALELNEKVYNIRCKVLGEEHPDTLTSLDNLASTYRYLGNHNKAFELHENAYTLHCKVLGEEHHNTLRSLNNLAITHSKLGNYKKATELNEKAHSLH